MYYYKLTISYNGGYFHGWQKNHKFYTIQEAIEEALEKIHGEKIYIVGASRTDAGVHALNQCCHFQSQKNWKEYQLCCAINFYLNRRHVVIMKVEKVNENFHARFNVIQKRYSYTICTSQSISPLLSPYMLHWPFTINYDKLEIAINLLTNCFDFCNFYRHEKDHVVNTRIGLNKITYTIENEILKLYFYNKNFLYHQIRYMVMHILNFITKEKQYNLQYFLIPISHYLNQPLEKLINKNLFQNSENESIKEYKKFLAPSHGLCLEYIEY